MAEKIKRLCKETQVKVASEIDRTLRREEVPAKKRNEFIEAIFEMERVPNLVCMESRIQGCAKFHGINISEPAVEDIAKIVIPTSSKKRMERRNGRRKLPHFSSRPNVQI